MKLSRIKILFSLLIMLGTLLGLTSCEFSKGNDTGASYVITFDVQGHGEKPADIEEVTAIPATLPVLTEEGYTFGGWYTNSECSKIAVASTKINSDITLYAKWSLNKYTITFDVQGGSSIENQVVEHGSTIAKPKNPVKAEYTFGGWYKEAACTNTWDFNTVIKEDVTLYAKWIEVVYNVTFYPNGHGFNLDQFNVSSGSKLSELPELTETGYVFGGWYYDEELTVKANNGDELRNDISLYAKWTEVVQPTPTYTVTYVTEHGAKPVDVEGVTKLPVTLPILEAEGYVFGGWYLDEACATVATAGAEITANTTLYAKWTEVVQPTPTYSVTYITEHGQAPASLTGVTALPLTLPLLEAEGYTFGGWYLDQACATVATAGAEITANATLYAKWTEVVQPAPTYSVTYVTEYGQAPANLTGVTALPLTLPLLEAEGYVFGGWYLDEACATVATAGAVITANTTLYAKWTEVVKYTVTFDVQGGTAINSLDVVSGEKVTQPTNPTKENHIFVGWYKEAACTNLWDFNNDVVTANITLYAKWTERVPEKVYYTVTFNSLGGSSVSPIELESGSMVTQPGNPTKTGYTFGGWYKESACTTAWNFNIDTLTENTTLYAKWTINSYTVTFDSQQGSSVTNQIINYGGKVTVPTAPTRSGYTFGGWYKETSCTNAWNFTTDTVTGPTTLYAKWTLNTYTITFNVLGHGTTPSPITNVTEITTLPTPSADGYTFGGWYYNSTCTNVAEVGDSLEGNITLYAKWTSTDGSTSGSFETPEIPGNISTAKATKTVFNNSLKKDGPLTQEGFPSVGTPKLLVVPVNLNSTEATTENIEEIKLAFDGTEEETGWESVRTFYSKSSYGKLNIDVDVVENWFTPSKAASYYESYYDSTTYDDGSVLILREVLAYLEGVMDLSQYDYDNDGYLDSVWLVYNAPVDFSGESDFYWAYVTWEFETTKYDGKMARNYGFAGIDFMHEETELYPTTGFVVDAHTYIHETGHLLGLDDYYDYAESVGPAGGLYSADMMDWNIGDHGMISKLLLGWVSPTVITGSGDITLTLESFTETGNFLLIANHSLTSIYDEYFLVEFYTNTGLNENDSPVVSTTADPAIGVRIVHVDAHKYVNSYGEDDWNDDEHYSTGFKYDNSGTSYKFIDMMRADYGSDMEEWATSASLFTPTSSVFGVDIFNNYKTHDGNNLNFTLKVNSMTNDSCSITITLE